MPLKPGCSFSVENTLMKMKFLKRIHPGYVKAYIDFHIIVPTKHAVVSPSNINNAYIPKGGAKREAVWIKVTKFTDTEIIGSVDTDLLLTAFHGLKDKDIVAIKPENVSQYLQ